MILVRLYCILAILLIYLISFHSTEKYVTNLGWSTDIVDQLQRTHNANVEWGIILKTKTKELVFLIENVAKVMVKANTVSSGVGATDKNLILFI